MLEKIRRWALVPLRLVIGYGFLTHGIAKIEKGPENFVAIVQAIGMPFPEPLAQVTIALEVICGLMMILGSMIPLIAPPMFAILAVALLTVHIQFGFTSIKLIAVTASGPQFGPPGMETDLLYMAGLAALVLAGPGPLALDNWSGRLFRSARVKSLAPEAMIGCPLAGQFGGIADDSRDRAETELPASEDSPLSSRSLDDRWEPGVAKREP
jgi:putative oxidoreductase